MSRRWAETGGMFALVNRLALAGLLLTGAAAAAEFAPLSVDMELKALTDAVYYVEGAAGVATDNEGFVSNAGVVITGDGVVVFDALGTPSLGARLIELIREKTDRPIRRVYVSHYHADHFYGLQALAAAGATVYAPLGWSEYLASPTAAERLEERQFSLDPWVNEDTVMKAPDETVETSSTFTLGGKRFTVNYQGRAHSDGDLMMLVEPDRVLFSGDLLFEGRLPFIGSGDTGHWLRTLERLETGGLRALVPGHGPASFAPAETMTLTRRYLAYLRDIFSAGVDELLGFDEIYANADWSEFDHLPAFADANRINAYQVFLSLEREMLAR